MITIGGLPVKTRIPLPVWILAGVFTLLSVASSLTHKAPEHVVRADATQHLSLF
jgi:hypothetical protein